MARLFVGNLPWDVDNQRLAQLVRERGFDVQGAVVMTFRETGRSKGFGFVDLSQGVDKDAAIKNMDGMLFEGRKLTVSHATDRKRAV